MRIGPRSNTLEYLESLDQDDVEDLPMIYDPEGQLTLADETPRGSLISVTG